MPQPLQHNPFNIATQTQSRSAYAACQAFEAAATAGNVPNAGGIESLVLARVLGYMLLYAPDDIALTNLSNEAVDAYTESLEKMANLGLLYVNAFIRCCECNICLDTGGGTSSP